MEIKTETLGKYGNIQVQYIFRVKDHRYTKYNIIYFRCLVPLSGIPVFVYAKLI